MVEQYTVYEETDETVQYTYSNREQSNKLYSVYEEETVTYSNREQSNILYTV